MLLKSIRFKIAIIYTAILAATLFLFSVILYHYVSRSLYDNMDSLLRSKSEGIVHAINSYWAAERLGLVRYGAKKEEPFRYYDLDFASVAQKWVQEKSKDPKLLDIIVQIFDTRGNPIVSSKHTQGITSVSRENFTLALEGKSFFDTLTSSFPTKRLLKLRVFIAPVTENDRIAYVVQVLSPLTSIETALYSLKVTLLLLLPLTVLLTGMAGSLLAKLTLRPVDSMIKTIHEITAENMKLRIELPDTKDEIQKLAETFNDMLSRLEAAFTSQKQLFEDLSHELKTPLTILKGEFEVMLKKMRSQQEYEGILRSSLEEIDKIVRLAENLLILASVEFKKILPEKKRLDLNLLVQSVANSMKALAEKKDIALDLVQHDDVETIGDEHQLKNLFLNILDNAVKYTPQGGRVTITLEKDDGRAKVIVKDTGPGIPEEELRHIFDRFYRSTRADVDHGFGLGLSIAKSVLSAHGGSIEVESRLGEGSAFITFLPLSSR